MHLIYQLHPDPIADGFADKHGDGDDPDVGTKETQRDGDEIAYGAAASLYSQKGRSWEDADRSVYYSRLFTEGWRKAFRVRKENPVAIVEFNPVRNHTFY